MRRLLRDHPGAAGHAGMGRSRPHRADRHRRTGSGILVLTAVLTTVPKVPLRLSQQNAGSHRSRKLRMSSPAPRFAMLASLSGQASSEDRRELLRKVTEAM